MNDNLFNVWTCPSEKEFTHIYDKISKLFEELKNDPEVTIKQFNPFTNELQTVKLSATTNTLTQKNNMDKKTEIKSSYDKELIQRALDTFKNNKEKHVENTDEYESPNTVITDLPSATKEEVTESTTEKVTSSEYEYVDHPQYYNNYPLETIEMIERIYGPEKTALWCEITALKYRLRMGNKPNEELMKDIKKEQWYLNKAKELRSKF